MSIVPIHALKIEDESPVDPFAVVRRLGVPIWVFDIDRSRIILANQAACDLWKAESEDEILARDFTKDMSSTVAKRLKQYQADFIATDAVFNEMWTLYPAGVPENVMVVYRGYPLPDGRMAMLCEVVGNAESQPDSLRSIEALLHTDVMITLFCKHGPPLYMNPAARNAFDPQLGDIAGIFSNPADYSDMIVNLSEKGENRFVAEVDTLLGRRWFDLSTLSCSDAATGAPAILLTAIDVSELKIARDRARYLADRDQLTGCFNRAYLQNFIENLKHRSHDGQMALIFLDIDHFKFINDRKGHEFGDAVLTQMATRIRQIIRSNDVLARLGGDEFVVLLNNIPSEEEVLRKISGIQKLINQPIVHDGTLLETTASMGVVMISPNDVDFTTAMREADIALYAAKQAGRDRAVCYSEDMGRAAEERATLETDLRTALEQKQFELEYQPRIDLKTGKTVSVEGLVRWNHPTKGKIQPGAFIAICEETGMIETLGRQVLEMGTKQAIAWHRAGLHIGVSLNLSPRQFFDPKLFQLLANLAGRPGFPLGWIELEITESVLVGEPEEIAKKLQKITELGYRIAIDDFGTGYSNLSYISKFPLDCIKIDRSFVSQLPETGPIVGLILTLGQQINAMVVAEGVQTQDQLDWLKEHDCQQVQGFLLAKPMPASEISVD